MLTDNTKKFIIKPTIIVLSLLFIFGVYKHVSSLFISDKDLIQTIWKELKLPEHSEVEIIYSSDHGFTGDGDRIYRIKYVSETKDTDLECAYCDKTFPQYEKEIVRQIFSDSAQNFGHINIDNFQNELEHIKNKKNSLDTLIITYSEKYDCYYVFESLI